MCQSFHKKTAAWIKAHTVMYLLIKIFIWYKAKLNTKKSLLLADLYWSSIIQKRKYEFFPGDSQLIVTIF